jgi:glycosyltransferase involved in cell wall biosynthesis
MDNRQSQGSTDPDPSGSAGPCRVSVVIKVLNEEQRIGDTLECALQAVKAVGGEVVLADSCSTDRTLEIAGAHPIRIVQLANPEERSCGIGAQLGYQHARGEFIYILDGDMHLRESFLPQALSFLRGHPHMAGVGGRVVEQNLNSLEFRQRGERQREEAPGPVDRLDCGGLYRRSAIASAGYFADRNLHSYEEFELAARLRGQGWELWRMPIEAVSHFGHDTPPYDLLMRRWRSGYICGLGELVRAAFHQPQFKVVLREVRELRIYAAMLGLLALVLVLLLWPASPWPRLGWASALLIAPVAFMAWRKKSLERGLYAVVSWGFNALGLVRGMLRKQRPPTQPVQGHVLQEGDIFPAPPEPQLPCGTPAIGRSPPEQVTPTTAPTPTPTTPAPTTPLPTPASAVNAALRTAPHRKSAHAR